MNHEKTVFFARNLADAVSHLNSVHNLEITAGCTLSRGLPQVSLNVRNIPELNIIDRKEHFIEIGSAVSLAKIISIGQKRLPQVFYEAIQTTATPFVRNIATIGGNICAVSCKEGALSMPRSLYAALSALDARLEFANFKNNVTIHLTKFEKVPEKSVLTTVKIPLEEWDISVFFRIGPMPFFNEKNAFFVFLAKTHKNIISDTRIVYSGLAHHRINEHENLVLGIKLPLTTQHLQNILEHLNTENIFENPVQEAQYRNLFIGALEKLR
ncbi:MAG: FAD binding domain-containing protein [Treponemataceae bacterium]|nr:MAG: FAD binding domain-containing protein [Treponemataceae bacterium]